MRFVALVSGGKDSIYSIIECLKQGHEIVACVHLARAECAPKLVEKEGNEGHENEEEEESYMYQTTGSEAVRVLVEECLGLPLIYYPRRGRSLYTSLLYSHAVQDDEVEDLYQALRLAQEQLHFKFQGVCSGAILSTYQRVRVEHVVCARLGLTSLAYLWRKSSQRDLLSEMIHHPGMIDAVLVRVAAPPGLVPHKHLNQPINGTLITHFEHLFRKYQMHMCGEGGEYETLVLDCPIYIRRLVLYQVEVVEINKNDGVGELRIHACHSEKKTNPNSSIDFGLRKQFVMSRQKQQHESVVGSQCKPTQSTATATVTTTPIAIPIPSQIHQACIRRNTPSVKETEGGLLYIGEIFSDTSTQNHWTSSTTEDELERTIHETQDVLQQLQQILSDHGCTPLDVVFVHLYLSNMAHFAIVNQYYRDVMGIVLPPSRSCVGLGTNMPYQRRIQLDCIVLRGSGNALRGISGGVSKTDMNRDDPNNEGNTDHSTAAAAAADRDSGTCTPTNLWSFASSPPVRHVLHVQSISHWAPVCVGPYSQVNTVAGCHFVAGQIGLDPATMRLRMHAPSSSLSWQPQLVQAMANTARILDSLRVPTLLQSILSGMIYIHHHVYNHNHNKCHDARRSSSFLQDLQAIWNHQFATNGGVVAGLVDGKNLAADDLYEGYEDEETRQALVSSTDTSHHPDRLSPLQVEKEVPPIPILVVVVADLPMNALIELEIIAATREALSMPHLITNERAMFTSSSSSSESDASVHDLSAWLYCRGSGAISFGLVVVYAAESFPCMSSSSDSIQDDHHRGPIIRYWEPLFTRMLQLLSHSCASTPVHVPPALHIRLFYDCASGFVAADDDDSVEREARSVELPPIPPIVPSVQQAFANAVTSSEWNRNVQNNHNMPHNLASYPPAISTIPVPGLAVLNSDNTQPDSRPLLCALQVIMWNPVRAETDLWIHQDCR